MTPTSRDFVSDIAVFVLKKDSNQPTSIDLRPDVQVQGAGDSENPAISHRQSKRRQSISRLVARLHLTTWVGIVGKEITTAVMRCDRRTIKRFLSLCLLSH